MGYYKPFKYPIAISVLIVFFTSIISVLSTWLFGRLIDNATNFEKAMVILGIIFAVRFVSIMIGYLSGRIQDTKLIFKIHSHANSISMKAMKKLSIGQFRGQDSGKIQSIITRGEQTITEFMFTTVFNIVPMLMQIVISLAAIVIMDLKIGLVVMSGCVLYGIQTRMMTEYITKRLKKIQKMRNNQNAKFKEILDKSFLIKMSSKENEIMSKHAQRYNRYNGYGEKMWLFWDNNHIVRSVVADACMMLVAIIAISGITSGEYRPGQLAVFWILAGRSIMNLGPLSRQHREIIDMWSRLVDYMDILNLEPEVKNPEKPINRPRLHGDVHIQNVTFSYPKKGLFEILKRKQIKGKKKKDDKGKTIDVIKDVTLDIKSGEKVALVGKSGSGKSTLVQLILRGYDPKRGSILIDGYDLRQYDVDQFRSQVGVVEQNVELFNDTLLGNILFALPDCVDKDAISHEAVMEVCDKAHITEFWDRLEERGLYTMLGENGVMLSGGQRQRVGIARALIKNPSILILDEATSNLDSPTEKKIKEAIDEASKGKTTVIIAHRLSTVKDADKIVVMDQGRIISVGTHAELENNCEKYRELVQHQIW